MDIDDGMTSSSTSSNGAMPADQDYEDDNLFPESNNGVRPRTPLNDHLNATAPGELSPPRSQTQSHAASNGHAATISIDNTPVVGGEKKDDRPGAAWKNKKAQEEMQRAWDNIVDREFSLKEFGDVILLGKQQRGES